MRRTRRVILNPVDVRGGVITNPIHLCNIYYDRDRESVCDNMLMSSSTVLAQAMLPFGSELFWFYIIIIVIGELIVSKYVAELINN